MGFPPFSTVGFQFCIIVSILSQIACPAAAAASSTIALGGSLSGSQTIISADGMFALGLFSLSTGSSSMYLGIWYASVNPFTAVWVANREEPVTQAATFGLSAEGGLSLTDSSRVVWTKGSNFKNISSARLMDTGNFVLMSSNSTIMWQTFDEPGDTWLPTMSLGSGKQIRSWLTPNDPSFGPYALQMGDSKLDFVSIYNDSRQYWSSGDWNGQIFSNVQEMTANWIYNFTLNDSGFTWYVKPGVGINFNVSRFVMTSSGQIRQSSYVPGKGWNVYWNQPKDPCNVIGACGINGICNSLSEPNCKCPDFGFQPVNKAEWDDSTPQVSIHGCERASPLNCSLGISNDEFYALNGTLFDMDSASSLQVEGKGECQNLCLKNCSCSSFYYEGSSGNCSTFVGNLFNGRQSSTATGTFYIRVSAKDMPASDHSSKRSLSGKAIGAAVGAGAAIVAAGALIVGYVMAKRKRRQRANGEAGLRAFTYAELQAATKNFRDKLGSGGFGAVYKGVVGSVTGGGDSLSVAVKKLQRLDEGEKQFRAEVRTIGTIQHVNLVRLLGFCSEGKQRLLVYEMAENGSLGGALFAGREDGSNAELALPPPLLLSWQQRFHVALGAARGLAYLHESCRECIIHCDIKPENILLDREFNAKVADFGLAKLIGHEFSRVLTTLRGTRGYLAPEWIAGLPITSKADVYSFGMTLLELVSGRRNIQYVDHGPTMATTPTNPHQQTVFFPIFAAQLIHQSNTDLTCLVDPRLQGDFNADELQRMVYSAVWCIQDNEDLRPSMGKVVQVLEGSISITPPPVPTSLQSLIDVESFVQGAPPISSSI